MTDAEKEAFIIDTRSMMTAIIKLAMENRSDEADPFKHVLARVVEHFQPRGFTVFDNRSHLLPIQRSDTIMMSKNLGGKQFDFQLTIPGLYG